MNPSIDRRSFLRAAGAFGVRAVAGSSVLALGCDGNPVGELEPPDANGIRLPAGFRSRVLARSGQAVGSTGYVWHGWPDGAAVFATNDAGWIYVSNAELDPGGGVGALRFAGDGEIISAYPICAFTRRNCAGGATPWDTWLTCEEVATGLVWECDPWGTAVQIARPGMGTFNHEAVAFDSAGRAYLTEDRSDGLLYRFTPNASGDLGSGVLEALAADANLDISWLPVPNPNPASGQTETRYQVPGAYTFAGGEGIDAAHDHLYFTTKRDNRVWDVDLVNGKLGLHYDFATDALQHLSGVDNIVVAPNDALIVAEDGGDMELVLLTIGGIAVPLARFEGQPGSELAGPAFDPSFTRLYVSSQRGIDGNGITYEIEGPFDTLG